MTTRNSFAIAAIVGISLLLTALILHNPPTAKPETEEHEASLETDKPTQPTKRLRQGSFELDLELAESKPSAPHFKASAFWAGKPIAAKDWQLSVAISRPGTETENLSFENKNDHFESLQPVDEPHVFKLQVNANYRGRNYRWQFWLVENGIELTDAELTENGIELKTAGPAVIDSVLTLPGQVQLNPRRTAHLVPRVSGVVVQVDKFLGDSVERNGILAVLESGQLANLKSIYLTSLRNLALARVTFQREQQLWQEKISAELDYLKAKTQWQQAKAQVEAAAQNLLALDLTEDDLKAISSGQDKAFNRYELRAPFAGEVVEKHLAVGEGVKADTPVYTLTDVSTVWVEVNVYSKDLNAVSKNQTVTVRSEELGQSSQGKLFYIEPIVGTQTRSAKAYVEVPNLRREWRSGLFVSVEVPQSSKRVPVAVAADAVQTYRDQPVVFVRHGELFEPRTVVIEPRGKNSRWVAIGKGLKAGERYAAQGSFALKSELGKSGASHPH